MNRLRHWLAHRLHWNYGTSKAFWEGDRLMIKFICSGCGKKSGIHETALPIQVRRRSG